MMSVLVRLQRFWKFGVLLASVNEKSLGGWLDLRTARLLPPGWPGLQAFLPVLLALNGISSQTLNFAGSQKQ